MSLMSPDLAKEFFTISTTQEAPEYLLRYIFTTPWPQPSQVGFHQRARPLFPMSPGLGRGSKGGFRLALSAVSTWRARFPEQVLGHLGPAPPPAPLPCPLVVHLALGLGQGPRSQEPLKPPGSPTTC